MHCLRLAIAAYGQDDNNWCELISFRLILGYCNELN